MSSARPYRLLGALALTVVAAVGCAAADSGTANDDVPTRAFAADNGEITIPADPKRVIATGYAVPVLIEADAALVGIAEWGRGLPMMTDEDRATYDELDKVAGDTTTEMNYEAIAGANPDLIVISVPQPVLADIDLARLESVAPVVAISPSLPAAWRELSRRQADAAGRLDNYDAAKTAYEQKAAGLADKYRDALAGMKFGHLGAYGDMANGTFQREFAESWGTNIATDVGVDYYGEVKEKGGGSRDVSEYPSIEELPASFAEADAITYTLEPDGSVSEPVQYVLDSELWENLPAVKAGKVFPLRYTEAATYASALKTLDAVDTALTPVPAQ